MYAWGHETRSLWGVMGSGLTLDFTPVLRYILSMHKMFSYRLYPTNKQLKSLEATLEECRWLYNRLLATQRDV
jgi:hypothetical protein